VFDTFNLPTVGGPGTLNTMTVYKEAEADIIRSRYKSNSISSLRKDFKSYYDNLYDGVESLKDPIFDDDSLSNEILVEESYKINDIWKSMVGNDKNIAVEFTPYSILDVFILPNETQRETPFALYYPTHKKHQITVKLPRRWPISKDNSSVHSKSFDFSITSKMNTAQDILYINYEYKNKTSYVKPEDFEEYYTKIKEVEQILGYYIYIPKSEANSGNFDTPLFSNNFTSSITTILYWVIGLMSLIVIGLVIFVVKSNRNRS
jgi:hypothetical protein